MNFFSGWQVEQQWSSVEVKPAAADEPARNYEAPPVHAAPPLALHDESLSEESLSEETNRATADRPSPSWLSARRFSNARLSTLGLSNLGLSNVQLSNVRNDLRLAVQEIPVHAVADYSVGYGKQVFFGVVQAARKWHADDASAMAAGVAYYLALSLFPMLLLLTAGLGLVFRFTSVGHDAELQILSIVAEHCSPTLEQQVRDVLSQLREQSLVGGPFGLVTAVMAAIGVFYRFERAFDRIWKVEPPADANWRAACMRIVRQRFSACILLASVGVSIVFILLANVAVGFVHAWMARLHVPGAIAVTGVDACATLLLNATVFGMLYHRLPKRRIQWVDALRGGLLASRLHADRAAALLRVHIAGVTRPFDPVHSARKRSGWLCPCLDGSTTRSRCHCGNGRRCVCDSVAQCDGVWNAVSPVTQATHPVGRCLAGWSAGGAGLGSWSATVGSCADWRTLHDGLRCYRIVHRHAAVVLLGRIDHLLRGRVRAGSLRWAAAASLTGIDRRGRGYRRTGRCFVPCG